MALHLVDETWLQRSMPELAQPSDHDGMLALTDDEKMISWEISPKWHCIDHCIKALGGTVQENPMSFQPLF